MTFTAPALNRYAGPPAVRGYVLGEFLGRGSTAVAWAATHVASGERVALKILDPGGDEVDVEREEGLGQRVGGAHLLAVRGRVDVDDGRIALVLRLADGGSLRDVVTIRGALPLGEVVTALTPLATALAELHDAGVVHADVAPGNVLFTTDGRPMLADLSSAWLVDDGWPEHPRGTPGFAAPEVLTGRPPVPASDIWSLGALAWYARTGGRTPPEWVGDLHWTRGMAELSPGADADGFGHGTIADVTEAVGPELTPLLLRMLADDPEARPSGAEVALALYRVAAPEPVRLVGHHPDPAAAVTTRIRRDAAETRSRSERREVERAERRRHRGRRRRHRLRQWLVPRATGSNRSSSTAPSATSSEGSAGQSAGAGPGTRADRGARLTWRSRLAVVALVGLVLTGGMLGLLWVNGGPLDPAISSGETAGSPSAAPTERTSSDAEAASTVASSGSAATGGGISGSLTQAAPWTAAGAASGRTEVLARDPIGGLQRLADQRAAALVAADPLLLVNAERVGSAAYEGDARTVTRLREQGQRYAGLSFRVRSAEVLTVEATTVVLRATVDRSAYQVTGGGGVSQSFGPGPGSPLRYTLSHTDGAWRLSEVGPP